MIYVTVNGNDIPHGRYGVFMSIKSVKFRGRHNSWRAVTALVTGSLAIILFIVMSAMAAASKGSKTSSTAALKSKGGEVL